MAWKPLTRPEVDLASLSLDAKQAAVAGQLDGTVDEEEVALLTGLRRAEVSAILDALVVTGVVAAPGAEDRSPEERAHSGQPERSRGPLDRLGASGGLPLVGAGEPPPTPVEGSGEPEEEGPEAPENPTHRQLFETALRHQPEPERQARARSCSDPELTAYAFDPLPSVIAALLENPRAGLTQARLVARHHQHPVGLEQVVRRGAFAADAGVRRALLQNQQLPQALYARLWGPQRLLVQHQHAVSRELSERTRRFAREALRQRFATAPAEERVELVFKTEGRCLALLVGIGIDSKTSSLLCHRTSPSTLLVQNLARWAAAPPAVIAHLLKQELVRRTPQLRLALERHPNAPHGR